MRGKQNPELLEFGDRFEDLPRKTCIRVPAVEKFDQISKKQDFQWKKIF